MKIRYLKLKKWLLVTLGGLLGVSLASCDKDPFGTSCEYGTPEATYHVKGAVVDEQGHPITGIGVLKQTEWSDESNSFVTTGYQDTTDQNGNYNITLRYTFPRQPISLDFNDFDGAQNGHYLDTIVTSSTEDIPLTDGDGRWFEGEGTITINVRMKEKTNE